MLLGRSVSGPGLGIRNTHLILLNGHEFGKIAVESSLAAGHRTPLSTSDELLFVSAVQDFAALVPGRAGGGAGAKQRRGGLRRFHAALNGTVDEAAPAVGNIGAGKKDVAVPGLHRGQVVAEETRPVHRPGLSR